MPGLQHKYDVLLAAFVGFLMGQTGCTRQEATMRIATLCVITEQRLFGPDVKMDAR